MMKKLDFNLFDDIEKKASANPRRRLHFDLRTSADVQGWSDMSQRMLNVLMTDTVIPIHRHTETNEVVIVMRGSGYEIIYDDNGNELERVHIIAGSDCSGVVVPMAAWHTFVPEVDGTTIFEAKDRPYDPVLTEEFLNKM